MNACCIVGCPYYNNRGRRGETTFHVFPDPKREPYRHQQWRDACHGNVRMRNKTAEQLFLGYRICRRHFDRDARNGGCKRLRTTAVPTLALTPDDDDDDDDGFPPDPDDAVGIDINDEESAFEGPDDSAANQVKIKSYDRKTSVSKDKPTLKRTAIDEEYAECVASKRQKTPDNRSDEKTNDEDDTDDDDNDEFYEEVEVYDEYSANVDGYDEEFVDEEPEEEPDEEQQLEEQSSASALEIDGYKLTPIDEAAVAAWRSKFYACPKNRLAQNVCSRVDPFEVCISRQAVEATQHVFAHRIETEGKPMTNQKNSGRCWLFAALNCIRIPFAKQHNLEEFEFSQGYLFYWDKIERCHYFLNNVVETARRGEDVTGRLVTFLLSDPTCDGGQWDMLVNLIKKYGLMPKKYFPESFCTESSMRLNAVLKSKLREYTKVLRDLMADSERSDDDVRTVLAKQMEEIYTVVGICLGIPAERFTWEYTDKAKAYKSIGPVTPLEFYERHVRPIYNVDDKVVLMTDPRPTNHYNEMYTVDCLGNVVGGRPVLYNNQPVEFLMDMVAASIKSGEPIWFGCEVSKRFAVKLGIEDLTIHDFKLVFGVDIQTTLSKADRLLYGESAMTHAMVFTAVTCDDAGKPTKFRVENSWGEDRGEKGYLYMSAEWFKEFVFEVVVDKSLVPADVLEVMNKKPIVLPAWDPMGTLAQ